MTKLNRAPRRIQFKLDLLEDAMRWLSARTGLRRFDPVVVGKCEADAWVSYYRREWLSFLRASVGMIASGFNMSRRDALAGAWWVLRANQVWSPYPDNDPDAARTFMRRFYALVDRSGLPLDPEEAAYFEVEWWRVHRERQRESAATEEDIVEALVDLYSYVYRTDRAPMVPAARHRVEAMRLSDAWVLGGCQLDDSLLASERRELVASYTALRDAVDRTSSVSTLRMTSREHPSRGMSEPADEADCR